MRRWLAAALASLMLIAFALPVRAQTLAQTEEQIGAQVYEQLAKSGQIVTTSPWYAVLNPIGERIARVANPQYQFPFHFILVNQKQPNAFAVPGGNVYVTLPLMSFVQNVQELAGVLCHETSHDIHHDVIHLAKKDRTVNEIAAGLSILIGGRSPVLQNILGVGANLEDLHFSRQVEEAADLKGAQTCAEAGYDPWGMVWLFEKFSKAGAGGQMEILSDHPTDQQRIAALKHAFAANPRLYGRFSSNIATATPIPSYRTLAARDPHGHPFAPARRAGY